MFLITTEFQKSRSRRQPDKPGRVLFRIACKSEGDTAWIVRRVSSDVCGDRDNVIEANRDKLIPYLRMIYCIIERRDKSETPYTVDDVVADLRKATEGDESMAAVIDRSDEDFPLRADIVSVGNEFKGDFKFVYPGDNAGAGGLLEYIKAQSLGAKNDGRASRARSYNSTLNSLSKFLTGADIDLTDVDRRFISDYSSWLKDNGVGDSTQSFYLRTLRSILNHAKENGVDIRGDDLFGGINTRVVFKESTECKDGLSRETLRRISSVDLSANREAEIVRDMFMFAFYCRGMELVDVVNLMQSDVKDGVLEYRRRSKGLLRSVVLDQSAVMIIERYRDVSETHVFPLWDMYKGLQQYSVNDLVRRQLQWIGTIVGVPQLTFKMNISTWRQLMSQLSATDLLLGSA